MANFHDSHRFQSNNFVVVFLLVLSQIQVCRVFFMILIRLDCYYFNSLIFVTVEAFRIAHFKFLVLLLIVKALVLALREFSKRPLDQKE